MGGNRSSSSSQHTYSTALIDGDGSNADYVSMSAHYRKYTTAAAHYRKYTTAASPSVGSHDMALVHAEGMVESEYWPAWPFTSEQLHIQVSTIGIHACCCM